VDRDRDAGAQQAREVVRAQIGRDAQRLVRQRAHRQRDLRERELVDERRILVAVHAVIDALGAEQRERLADVRRRAFFAGVRDHVQSEPARLREHARELARRVAALAGVEPDADESIAERQRGLERGERVVLREVAQEAQDQRRRDAVRRARLGHRVGEPADHHVHADAARGVALRIEEQLGVHDVVGRGALEVRARELGKVGAVAEHRAAGVVEVEERLQVGELVRGAHLVDGSIRQLRGVLLRQPEHELRLERALDVEVQLDLRQPGNQAEPARIQRHDGNIPIARPHGRGYGRDPT
jgi:hypothetical protein